MTNQSFDYEDTCMGARSQKPESYRLSFADDYRLRSLTGMISQTNGRLLDIGCGGGRIAETLPYYYPGVRIYGCDISKSAISYARKYGSGKVAYAAYNGKRLPYEDNYFDVCICLDVLEHIPDVPAFLKEVRRILRKNGKFFLIVPCEGQPFTYTWFFAKTGIGRDLTRRFFGHIHPEFTHRSVALLLREHGFTPVAARYSEHPLYQWLHVVTFFIPKILLERVFGEKTAHAYTNASLLRAPPKSLLPLMVVRNVWFLIFDFLMKYPMNWETILLTRIPVGAWKYHILCTPDGGMEGRKKKHL